MAQAGLEARAGWGILFAMEKRPTSQADRPVLSRGVAIVCLTGETLSSERGVDSGPWQGYRVEELMTPAAFARDADLVWQYYNWRRETAAQLSPGRVHEALADFAARSSGFSLFTLGIEGFHQRAGSEVVEELHGSLWRVRCVTCQASSRDERVPFPHPVACEACGAALRPDVVWFGETIDPKALARAVAAVDACRFLVLAGTGRECHPAATLALRARRTGAVVIEVNPESTGLTPHVNHSMHGVVSELLPGILT